MHAYLFYIVALYTIVRISTALSVNKASKERESKRFVDFSKDVENQQFSEFGTLAQAKYDVSDNSEDKGMF